MDEFKEEFKHPSVVFGTAALEHYNEINETKHLLPRFQKLQDYYSNKATSNWNKAETMQRGARTFEDVARIDAVKKTAGLDFTKASKYGFYAGAQKGLHLAGKAAGVYEIGDAWHEIYNAKASERTKVSYEQAGKLIGGKLGTAMGLGAGVLLEEFSPFISTPLAISAIALGNTTGEVLGKNFGNWVYEKQEEIAWFNKG